MLWECWCPGDQTRWALYPDVSFVCMCVCVCVCVCEIVNQASYRRWARLDLRDATCHGQWLRSRVLKYHCWSRSFKKYCNLYFNVKFGIWKEKPDPIFCVKPHLVLLSLLFFILLSQPKWMTLLQGKIKLLNLQTRKFQHSLMDQSNLTA